MNNMFTPDFSSPEGEATLWLELFDHLPDDGFSSASPDLTDKVLNLKAYARGISQTGKREERYRYN